MTAGISWASSPSRGSSWIRRRGSSSCAAASSFTTGKSSTRPRSSSPSTPPWISIAFRPIPEDASRIAAVQRGEVDIIDAVPYDRIKELQGSPTVRISQRQGEQIYVGLDTLRVEPLKKREVRQALNYAVNADALVKNLLLGYAVRLNGPMFPTTPGFDEKLPAYPYDPERAKRMLAQAGYPGGFDVEFAISPPSRA